MISAFKGPGISPTIKGFRGTILLSFVWTLRASHSVFARDLDGDLDPASPSLVCEV